MNASNRRIASERWTTWKENAFYVLIAIVFVFVIIGLAKLGLTGEQFVKWGGLTAFTCVIGGYYLKDSRRYFPRKSFWLLSSRTLNRIPAFISLLIIGACVLTSSCRGSQTIWSAEATSSDGRMIATGHAFANGGFGVSGNPATFVDLNWTTGSQKPVQILSLENESDTPDDIKVGMNWLNPTHLELTYKGNSQHIAFQAVKFAGVDISLRDLSSPSSSK